ncbi:MAG: Gfo/Idh/MocA family oxidoreductase [Oscillospiraceae bacterium]|nr:Gfo/Idh/MocA family oxidoreductase [Oscillospiraceae bacterium]
MSETVRAAIIGIGNMGTNHANNLIKGEVPGMELVCVCDTDPARLEWAKEKLGEGVATYQSSDEMFAAADTFDALIVAVPHYDHPSLAIRAFQLGKHVLVEKPAGVYTKNVREMNAAAEKAGTVFSMMFQQRTNPVYAKVREMIQGGELGKLNRMVWIVTNWYRAQAYHDSSAWRSTWEGEGGGVLINQAPHNIDLWQWMCGMPTRVRAFADFGKHYNIEVDDDVTAYAEYECGMTATFITCTAESPGTNRLEISGTKGKIVVEGNRIAFWRNEVDEREFNANFKGVFGNPKVERVEVTVEGESTNHMGITRNFTNAILGNEELIAPGPDGINELMLSNAIHLSAWTDGWVNLPIDEDLYYNTLQEKIKGSTFKKTVSGAGVADVSGTH